MCLPPLYRIDPCHNMSFRYEGNLGIADPHKKSGGQLGSASTTPDPSQTAEAAQARKERGEKTAENIRYGQAISEQGGMGGMTANTDGTADKVETPGNADHERKTAGYGEGNDMDKSIGA